MPRYRTLTVRRPKTQIRLDPSSWVLKEAAVDPPIPAGTVGLEAVLDTAAAHGWRLVDLATTDSSDQVVVVLVTDR